MEHIGEKHGRLTIVGVYSRGQERRAVCRCECGREKDIRLHRVLKGITVSCGCIKRIHSVKAGQRVGRLTVESTDYVTDQGTLKAPVVCECGTRKLVAVSMLALGTTKSCGCLVKENPHSIKHGGEGTPIYGVWSSMKARCGIPSAANYANYGGRGIRVCDQWSDDFVAFRSWALLNGYRRGLQIDRVDNDGNYTPENCRWVRPKVNANNRRTNVRVKVFGESKTMAEWSRDPRCVVSYSTLKQRIRRQGMPPAMAITEPTKPA